MDSISSFLAVTAAGSATFFLIVDMSIGRRLALVTLAVAILAVIGAAVPPKNGVTDRARPGHCRSRQQ